MNTINLACLNLCHELQPPTSPGCGGQTGGQGAPGSPSCLWQAAAVAALPQGNEGSQLWPEVPAILSQPVIWAAEPPAWCCSGNGRGQGSTGTSCYLMHSGLNLVSPLHPTFSLPCVWVGFCAYRSSEWLLVMVASHAPPSTEMLRWLLCFRSHSKQKAEAAPTTAQSSKPDQCLPQHFIAQEPLSQLCPMCHQPGMLQHLSWAGRRGGGEPPSEHQGKGKHSSMSLSQCAHWKKMPRVGQSLGSVVRGSTSGKMQMKGKAEPFQLS